MLETLLPISIYIYIYIVNNVSLLEICDKICNIFVKEIVITLSYQWFIVHSS